MQLKKVVNHGNVRWRVSTYLEGKRSQRFFPSKQRALEWIKLLKADDTSINFWSEISAEEERYIISAFTNLLNRKGYLSIAAFFNHLQNIHLNPSQFQQIF